MTDPRQLGRQWRKTIRIKQFLSEDSSSENARKVAGQVAHVLEAHREYPADDEFRDIAGQFDDLSRSTDGTCEDFNLLLADLYDWADANRVWIDG